MTRILPHKIRNIETACSVGDSTGRRLVLDIADRTLTELDAYTRIRSIARVDDGILTIGEKSWNLRRKRRVHLIGAGKACNAMAMAIDHVLGEYLTSGIAIVKSSEDGDIFGRTEVHVGGHPLPNTSGYRATQQILELVDQAGPDDLFIAAISGGSSALMNCPIDGISVEEEADATDTLLKSGASIVEINAVRRHISQVNGGRLAQRIRQQRAELIGFGISDAIGRPATTNISRPVDDYSSTPIGPDLTTLQDARRVIDEYELGGELPTSIVKFLDHAGPEWETPKSFPDNTYFLINTLPDSVAIAREAALSEGVNAYVLTSSLEGESHEAGTFMASIARQIQAVGEPFTPPCVLISAGETTTRIAPGDRVCGHGGPSQELTVGFALAASRIPGAVMFSIDSEGTDGTTSAAGGITDSTTLARAGSAGIDLRAALRGHASFEALQLLSDVVITGNTGTNVCDLNIMFVPEGPPPVAGLIKE